jgi:hypothetical protein
MAVDPAYSGTPLTSFERAVVVQHRPALRQDRLAFAWTTIATECRRPETCFP